MRLIPLAVAVWLAAAASAQDERLAGLHATLVTLRSHAAEATPLAPGGRPELTVAKHQLRDWIETQLGALKDSDNGDEKALAYRINRELEKVSVVRPKDDQHLLGSVGEVGIRIEYGMLIVTTQLGILCQYDTSAYVYQFVGGHWRRDWESEQDNSPSGYSPQDTIDVHLWPSVGGPPFVMTLGNDFGCASAWHRLNYRVWRIDPSGPKLLIDGAEIAYLRAQSYLMGSIGQGPTGGIAPVDVLIEFAERSIDGMVTNREAVRHYLIDGDKVCRLDPVALSPRDFVDEWLTRPWSESATWSASPTLQQSHRRLNSDFVAGEFLYPTMHCQTPDLWQVGFAPWTPQNNGELEPASYFLVRWRPPYQFTMVDIGNKPWPLCTEKDPEADAWRTLFNAQEWRW